MSQTNLNLPLLRQRIRQLYGTQSAFARHCGWSRQYVSRILEGESAMSLQRAADLASALNIGIDDILRTTPQQDGMQRRVPNESIDDVLREVVGKYAAVETSADAFAARKAQEIELEE